MSKLESVDRLRELFMGNMATGGATCIYIPRDASIDLLNAIDRELEERYVELPVDADGVPIHVGDVLVRDKSGKTVQVYGVSGGSTVFYNECDDYRTFRMCFTTNYRHYKPPTVEHELGEMHNRLLHVWQSDMDNALRQDKIDDILAEYAKKLRLAEKEEA